MPVRYPPANRDKAHVAMAQAIFAAIGGILILMVLINFVRLLWRKPPRDPGSSDPLGGMQGGPDTHLSGDHSL